MARISTRGDKAEGRISQRKENERTHTYTRTLRGLHTHMQHNWNGLHLDWCRCLEACIYNVLKQSRIDFIFLVKLLKRSNWVRKISSLDMNFMFIPEEV